MSVPSENTVFSGNGAIGDYARHLGDGNWNLVLWNISKGIDPSLQFLFLNAFLYSCGCMFPCVTPSICWSENSFLLCHPGDWTQVIRLDTKNLDLQENVPWHRQEDERTILKSWFSLSTLWVLKSKLRLSDIETHASTHRASPSNRFLSFQDFLFHYQHCQI